MFRRISALFFLILAVFVIIRVCVPYVFLKTDAQKALAFNSGFSSALLSQNAALLEGQARLAGELSPEQSKVLNDNIGNILTRVPLSSRALGQAAQSNLVQSGTDKLALLKIAQRRDPRDKEVNRAIYQAAIDTQDYNLLAQQLSVMARLYPDEVERLFPALLFVANVPEAQDPLINSLALNPKWAQAFLTEAMAQGDSHIGFALEALRQFELMPDVVYNVSHLRGLLMTHYVRQRDVETAHELWVRGNGNVGGESAGLRNTNFEPIDDRSIFNWSTMQNQSGYSVFQKDNGMIVSSAGKAKTFLTQQYFILPEQGEYILNVTLQGDFTDRNGHFEFLISCVGNNSTLATLQINRLKTKLESFETKFALQGKACAAQKIQLFHYPGSLAKRVQMRLDNVSIRSVMSLDISKDG